MSVAVHLSGLAVRSVVEGAFRVVGVEKGGEAVANFLLDRFRDQSQRVAHALEGANQRAWKALEISLAGDTWWDRAATALTRAEDQAFRQQVKLFLIANPHPELKNYDDYRRQALEQLRAARKAGHLSGSLEAGALAQQAGAFARFGDPARLLEAEWKAVEGLADELERLSYQWLAWLLRQRPPQSTPLLVTAARYFFRRAVEEDRELFQGLAFAQLEKLGEEQERGFACLSAAFQQQGQRLEELLGNVQAVVVESHGHILDIKEEQQRHGQRLHELYELLGRLQGQYQTGRREVRASDSLSIRSDGERQLVKQLVARYRALPEEQQRELPATLNAIGKLEVVAGDFEAAQQDFQRVAGLVNDAAARAEAHYNAYRASLEKRDWDTALPELLNAVRLDVRRFAPFPMEKFIPQRILGAGGFGLAFLCRHKYMDAPVVVKSLALDDTVCDADQVFSEARLLRQLDHPAIIRTIDCGYVDAAAHRYPFLVMDYFPGPTLEEHVRTCGPLKLEELLTLARAVVEGLHAAHRRNILHRDVKPANLLIKVGTSAADPWQVKIIDFGLALKQNHLLDAASTTRQGNTLMGGSIAGTIDYAAPEQMGKLPGAKIGPAADVYGFGRMCCYALFGTPNPLRAHWRQVPDELANVLEACLQEKPEQRLQDFGQVLNGLKAVQAPTEPVVELVRAGRPSRVLGVAQFLGSLAESCADHRATFEILACAIRVEMAVSKRDGSSPPRLTRLLESAEATADLAQKASLLLQGLPDVHGASARLHDVLDGMPPLRTIQTYINLAIEIGVPAYNDDDHRGCSEVYAGVARVILASVDGAESARELLRGALKQSARQLEFSDRAWTLRHAFDAILTQTPALEDYADKPSAPPVQRSAPRPPETSTGRERPRLPRRPGFSRLVSAGLSFLFLAISWCGALTMSPPLAKEQSKNHATAAATILFQPQPFAAASCSAYFVTAKDPPTDPVERLGQGLGMFMAALMLAAFIGVPGGLIIRSYRGWIFVLAIALGAPLAFVVIGSLIGKPMPWKLDSFLVMIGIFTFFAYFLAVPIKFVLWIARRL